MLHGISKYLICLVAYGYGQVNLHEFLFCLIGNARVLFLDLSHLDLEGLVDKAVHLGGVFLMLGEYFV